MDTSCKTGLTQKQVSGQKLFRCCVIGETSLLIRCSELLLQRGHTVRGVVSADPAVKNWAEGRGLRSTVPGADWLSFFRQQEFDYLFSIVNPKIVSDAVLALPVKGAINYHDALLPRYAGMYATSWAIMNRERHHGITWHVMASGVDQGDVLKQRRVDITERETAFSLNLKCYEAAFEAFSELVDELSAGTARPVPQDLQQRTYFGKYKRPAGGCFLSFNRPAGEICAFSRALDFGPGHNPLGTPRIHTGASFVTAQDICLFSSRSTDLPGTLKACDDQGLIVATADYDIRIGRLIAPDNTVMTGKVFLDRYRLKKGFRFTDPDTETLDALTERYAAAARQEPFWLKRLADIRPISISADLYPLPPRECGAFRAMRIPVPESFSAYAASFSDVSGWEALAAVLGAYLFRMTGRPDFDLGLSVEPAADGESCFPDVFSDGVPLRIHPAADAGFLEILRDFHREQDRMTGRETFCRDIFMRAPRLAEISNLRQNFFFPVMIRRVNSLDDYSVSGATEFSMVLDDDSSACLWVFDPGLISYETVRRLRDQFLCFLGAVARSPEKPVARLPVLSPEAVDKIVHRWNDTDTDYCRDTCIHHLFETQAKQHPRQTATLYGGTMLSYGDLDRKANQLAWHLARKGVGPETLVGISLDRSHNMIIALLGILKAGGAYVPLEPSFPGARLNTIIQRAGIRLVLSQEKHAGLFADSSAEVVLLDRSAQELSCEEDGRPPECGVNSENTAYVIFTSGSTGNPKGVVVVHRPVINLIEWVLKTFSFSRKDAVLFVTALSFDLSVFDIFGLLACGGSIHIMDDRQRRDTDLLIRMLCEREITFWDSAPAALDLLVPGLKARAGNVANQKLRLVFLSGDWIPLTLADDIRQIFTNAEVIGLGGATEATVWSNYFPIRAVDPRWRSIPYGRPIQNARYYILDQHLAPCPVGVAGDLFIGGECLSEGYLNEPALTANSFVPDPFSTKPGARMYRTGDTARFFPDGNMEFLGRKDFQVKVRGYRIELGEIEHALRSHSSVTEALVMVREDTPGDQKLVAYTVIRNGREPAVKELKNHVASLLPDYMVPNVIGLMAAMPLTANGKVDRKALPWPIPLQKKETLPKEAAICTEPDESEAVLALIREVLQTDTIGPEDDIFDFGATSLSLIRIAERIRERFGKNIRAEVFLDSSTAEKVAAHLLPAGGKAPVSCAGGIQPEPKATFAPCHAAEVIAKRSGETVAPGPDESEAVLVLIREVLQTDTIGPEDDIFDFGATSLSLIRIAEKIREHFGENIRAEVFLDRATPRAVAEYLMSRAGDEILHKQSMKTASRSSTGKASEKVSHRERPAPHTKKAGDMLVWIREVIGTDDIGLSDDIFDYGATSLNLIQIAERIREQYGVNIRAEVFLDNPTPENIAAYVSGLTKPSVSDEPVSPLPVGEPPVHPGPSASPVIHLENPGFVREAYQPYSGFGDFCGRKVSFAQFGGCLSLLRAEAVDGRTRYLYPSAGGLNAVQVYLWIKKDRVERVPEGVYYYHPVRHELFRISEKADLGPEILPPGFRPACAAAAFSIFFIARLGAIEPVYTVMSRALVTLDAGYMGQLLQSRQAAFGLGLCPVPGVDFERVRSFFHLDSDHLFIHCFLGGIPKTVNKPENRDDEKRFKTAENITGHFSGPAPDRSWLDMDKIVCLDQLNMLTDEEHAQLHREQRHIRFFSGDMRPLKLEKKGFDKKEYLLRATVRSYENRAIPFRQFSGFMGLLGCCRAEESSVYLYPSANNLHAVNVYVFIKQNGVAEIPAGIYCYHPHKHQLVAVNREPVNDPRFAHFPGNRSYYAGAKFSLFLVADLDRLRKDFGEEALHLAALEAGAMGQVIMDHQAEFDLGVCAIGAMRFDKIREDFNLRPDQKLIHSFLCGPLKRDLPVPNHRRLVKSGSGPRKASLLSRLFTRS